MNVLTRITGRQDKRYTVIQYMHCKVIHCMHCTVMQYTQCSYAVYALQSQCSVRTVKLQCTHCRVSVHNIEIYRTVYAPQLYSVRTHLKLCSMRTVELYTVRTVGLYSTRAVAIQCSKCNYAVQKWCTHCRGTQCMHALYLYSYTLKLSAKKHSPNG